LLPKENRLRKSRDIKAVAKHRQHKHNSALLSFMARENTEGCPRMVVVTSKKLGKAVLRNRIRRLVVEGFGLTKLTQGVDVVIYPQREIADKKPAEISALLLKGFHKCGFSLNIC